MSPSIEKLLRFGRQKWKGRSGKLEKLKFSKMDFLPTGRGFSIRKLVWGTLLILTLGEAAFFALTDPNSRKPASIVSRTAHLIQNKENFDREEMTQVEQNDQGIHEFTVGNYIKSSYIWQGMVNSGQKDPVLFSNLAISYLREGKIEDAEIYAEKSIGGVVVNPILLSNYGMVQMNLGKPDRAEKYFKKALKLDPDYLDGVLNFGKLEEMNGNWSGAIKLYKRYISNGNSDPLLKKILKVRIRKIYAISIHEEQGWAVK